MGQVYKTPSVQPPLLPTFFLAILEILPSLLSPSNLELYLREEKLRS